jgi:energy-coupling factor transport system substrate-specific component
VSWELASFLVLGAVLVGGFAWYERSRPPSQIVALVAALAALAVAGRVALAPIPNVVATTDIVLFAGYAIGGAPGFAVGALAGLVSNFWLGQGPWTPWQMAGWGMTGVFGAGLCLLTRQRAGRLTLAAACGLAGVLYGVLLNFSLMATYGGELSLDRFLALEVRAIPFDAAHALGNITLALIAGPAMVRMLIRFRERFEWRLVGRAAAAPVAALLLAVLAAGAVAPTRAAAAANVPSAADWLEAAQNQDGGFSSDPGEKSSIAITNWAMLGLEAAGRNPLDVRSGGSSAVGFLRRSADDINSTGDLARTVLALVGAGVEPRDFAGRNLLSELRGRRRRNGSFEGWPNMTAYSVLALRAGGAPSGLKRSLDWLRQVQNDDGGWGVVPRAPSDADTTGAVLQVIHGSSSARRALGYLHRAQRPSGGYAVGGNGAVNTQSTAWAVQGILAAGRDPDSFHNGGRSPLAYIAKRQAPDGHFRYSGSSDQTPVWVTGQVLVAAATKTLPLTAPARAPKPKTSKNSGSGSPTGPLPSSAAGRVGAGAGSGAAVGAAAAARGGSPAGNSARASGAAEAESASPGARVAPAGRAPASAAAQGKQEAKGLGNPSPTTPAAIGIGAAALALGGTWWLGRRRDW